MKRIHKLGGIMLALSLVAIVAAAAHAAPGDPLRVVTVPVPSPTGIGLSIADDSEWGDIQGGGPM